MGERHAARAKRLDAANEMIQVIASCGRRFFDHSVRGQGVTRLELDERGRVWLVDGWQGARIYTHYDGRWRKFSEGGTLWYVVQCLREYVMYGTHVPARVFGPWPAVYADGDLWGYGVEAMETVRAAAIRLRIIPAAPEVPHV